ncbi:hypothetical protein MRB53_037820 [Persea americana]|nr:hypothetical protein MRB53_037820 [Persea americana]
MFFCLTRYVGLELELSSHMSKADAVRHPGSFKQPPPGQPKSKPYNDKEEKMGEKVTGLDDKIARENFRVVIIRPQLVEMCDISDPSKARREVYTYNDKNELEIKLTSNDPLAAASDSRTEAMSTQGFMAATMTRHPDDDASDETPAGCVCFMAGEVSRLRKCTGATLDSVRPRTLPSSQDFDLGSKT